MTIFDIFIYGNLIYQVGSFFRSIYVSHSMIRKQKRDHAREDLQVLLYKLKIRKWTHIEEQTSGGRLIITPGPHFWLRVHKDV